jgi:hypothetical protein
MNQVDQMLGERPSVVLTPLEQQLTTIWSTVLQVPVADIHPERPFLELGGESISATLCVNRLLSLFNVDVPANALVSEAFTIRKLAALIGISRLK